MASPSPSPSVQAANRQSDVLRSRLNGPGILVMPGAYDVLSARLFEALGFPAIQGSSGAIAATFGLRDGQVLPRSEMIDVYQRMVGAVQVPVNADGEKGYGGPAEVAETVRQLVAVGAAGMNLEDSAEHRPGEKVRLLSLGEQLAKIQAVLTTRDALGSRFFLNARVDAFFVDDAPERTLAEAIERGNAYAAAGADCIFYLNVSDPTTIARLVREVRAPVSILANARCPRFSTSKTSASSGSAMAPPSSGWRSRRSISSPRWCWRKATRRHCSSRRFPARTSIACSATVRPPDRPRGRAAQFSPRKDFNGRR